MEVNNDYTCRKLEHTEFGLLVPLMQNCFGMDVNIDYFKWKYLDNPSGKVIGFVAIAKNGEIGAYYGVIPETYIINDKETLIYQSCDTMTHSRHRRRGLFQRLALQCYQYLRGNGRLFVTGFGGEQSTPGLVKFGWNYVADMRYFFFPRAFALANMFGYKSAAVKSLEASSIDKINHLALKSNSHSPIHLHKDPEIFKWRISNPLNPCQVLVTERNNTITSYLCYYLQSNKIILFDFYFETTGDGSELLGALKKQLLSEDKKGIIAFCQKDGGYARQLKNYGFIFNPFTRGPLSLKRPFMIFSDVETMNKLKNPNLWSVTSFDHDAM